MLLASLIGGGLLGVIFQDGPVWWRLLRVVFLVTGVHLIAAANQ